MSAPPSTPRIARSVVLLLLCPAWAAAHDSWLIVDKHVVNTGEEVWMSVATGEVFPFGDAPMELNRVSSMVDRTGGRDKPVPGLAPEDHALSVRGPLEGGGFHILGCILRPLLIEMENAEFDRYLQGERAEQAIAQRKSQVAAEQTVIERYTKYLKTVIEVHPIDPDDAGYAEPLGHRLEIIPLSNPTKWQARAGVRVRVLLDGHAWPDVPVSVGRDGADRAGYVSRVRTDLDGVAEVRLERAGHWFIKAHLIRPASGLSEYTWESFWATFTFKVQGHVDTEGDIQAVKEIHGRLTPWTVAGYRMGRRALKEFSLQPSSGELVARHNTPLSQPYTCIADGVQAATGVTIGKLSLSLEEVEAAEMQTEFVHRASGNAIVIRLRSEVIRRMLESGRAEDQALAMKMLTMTDEEMFEVMPRTPSSRRRLDPSLRAAGDAFAAPLGGRRRPTGSRR